MVSTGSTAGMACRGKACRGLPGRWTSCRSGRRSTSSAPTIPISIRTPATEAQGERRMPTPTDPPTRQSHKGFMLGMIGLFFGVLLLGAAATMWLGGSSPVGPVVGGPFALTDTNGAHFTDKDLKGTYALVYFGYTFCPDVCPTTLNQVAEALDELGPKAERIRPVFITIDPARDTPAVMKQYVSAFSPRLVGLTGSDAEIGRRAKEYRGYYPPARHRD